MFAGDTSFNQNISNWDVSHVDYITYMFHGASSFNQDIGGWDVSNVRYMTAMFHSATSFNQDIGSWNISQVSIMDDMFNGVTLSTANYNSLLLGWSNLTLQTEVTFDAGNSQCTDPGDPATARPYIVDTFNWTIYDGDGTHRP